MRTALLFSFLLGIGCADPLADARKADTIEAWETYLTTEPSVAGKSQADARLEELLLAKARETKMAEDYDKFLKQYPNSRWAKDAQKERGDALMKWCDTEDTLPAWQRCVDEGPAGEQRSEAKRRKHAVENRDKVDVGDVVVGQVNLAEDPKGPLDGWSFKAPVTNKGDKALEVLYIRVDWLDDSGKSLGGRSWPAVAPALPGNMPVDDAFKVPMKPGETRTWEYTSGDMPTEWKQKAKLRVVHLKWEGEDPVK